MKNKNYPNLLQLIGAVVFILWSMGKVPYGMLCWIIPYGVGTVLGIITAICERIAES